MNWKLAKTIMLLLLLAVNLVLGGLWLFREAQARAGEARAAGELCALLERGGLTVRPEQLVKTVSLTYDAERVYEEADARKQTVRDLPVWEQAAGYAGHEQVIISAAWQWHWGEELPVNGFPGYSAGHCLLALAEILGEAGVLEECELGFSAEQLSTDAVRLKPCWRFVISGREYYYLAV